MADTPQRPAALAWVDEARLAASSAPEDVAALLTPYRQVTSDLLAERPVGRPRTPAPARVAKSTSASDAGPGAVTEPRHKDSRPTRRGVPIALGVGAVVLVGAYVGATLLWPSTNLTTDVTAASLPTLTAPETTVSWPVSGAGAVAVVGSGEVVSSSDERFGLASITKLVTALMVLDRAPLAEGEDGQDFTFTWDDEVLYWEYLARNESAVPVPIDGTLTQLQMLQAMLMGSGSNYADRLVAEWWPEDGTYVEDATAWLAEQGLEDITVVDATGFSEENTGTPAAVALLAERAMANPVIAQIVGTDQVELPQIGIVDNTNELLDQGATGIKTGSLWGEYALAASDSISVEGQDVTVIAVVLGQPSNEARFAEAQRMLQEVSAEASEPATIDAGTVAATVTTAWGESAELTSAEPLSVPLWNGAEASPTLSVTVEDAADAGDEGGSLSLTTGGTTITSPLVLSDDIEPASAWWRLTHPLDVFGLN